MAGGEISLQVRSPQNRSWVFRYTIAARARWLGLGDESVVSLAMARQKAAKAREMIANGLDPLEVKRSGAEARKKEIATKTFCETMELYLIAQEPGWRNDKHRKQQGNRIWNF